ncbi:MAG TPA: DedA family protein [Methylomirabilota bacterium]|nr:DedA family protein [Methylomirabilota bacterium]
MEATEWVIIFLVPHLFVTVFVASAIDATGVPFPGRMILVLAGAFASTRLDVALAIVAATLGLVIGDHVLYLAGARGGEALLAFYCRLTLGSELCVENTLKYFRRFGPTAILLGRYSTGVRLFAAILSGSGHIAYHRFVVYDLIGSLIYATLWTVLGYIFSAQVETLLDWIGRRRALFLIVPVAIVLIVGYRFWRRRRHGSASASRNRILR